MDRAVRVNRPYQEIATTDMIAGWRVSCGNDWITPRISQGASAQFTSSRFAVSDVDGINLCHDETAAVLVNTARIYQERARWNLNLLLLMPDHLHVLVGVDGQTSLAHLIRDYKRITAKIAGVRWQRNFFDHRLHHDESLAEKFAYICQNPVRAGLVRIEYNWPYIFIPDQQSRR